MRARSTMIPANRPRFNGWANDLTYFCLKPVDPRSDLLALCIENGLRPSPL